MAVSENIANKYKVLTPTARNRGEGGYIANKYGVLPVASAQEPAFNLAAAPPIPEDSRPDVGYKTGQLLRGVQDIPNAALALGPNLINLSHILPALGPMAYDAITGGTSAGEVYVSRIPGANAPLLAPVQFNTVDNNLKVADPTSYGDKLLGVGGRALPIILAGGGIQNGIRGTLGNMVMGGAASMVGQGVTDATDNPFLGLLASALTPMAVTGAKGRMGVLTKEGRTRKLAGMVTDDLSAANVPVTKAVTALRNPQAPVAVAAPLTGSILEDTLPAHGPRLMSQVTTALTKEATPEAAAVSQALERNANARTAAIAAEAAGKGDARPQVSGTMAAQHEGRLATLEAKAAQRVAQAEQAIASRDVGPAATPATLGTTIGQKLEALASAISKKYSDVFKPNVVDPSGKSRALVPRDFEKDVANFYNGHRELIPEDLRGSADKISRLLNKIDPLPPQTGGVRNPYTGVTTPKAPTPKDFSIPYADVKVIRSYLTNTLRKVSAGPNADAQAAKGLRDLVDVLDGGVAAGSKAGVFDKAAAARYEAARAGYKKDIGTVRGGVTGEALTLDRQGAANWKSKPEQIVSRFLSTETNANEFLKQFGKDPQVMKALGDHLRAKWSATVAPGGTPGAAMDKAHFRFMRDNKTLLDALPQVKGDLIKAQAEVGHHLSKAEALRAKADTFQKESPTRFFANRKDANIQLEDLLNAPTRQADLPPLMARIKSDPALHDQAKTALANHMTEVAKGGAAKLSEFLETPANQSLLKGVYGGKAYARLVQVARDAQRDATLLAHTPAQIGKTPVSGSLFRSAISLGAHRPSLAADQAGQAMMRGPLVSGNKAMQRLYAQAATQPNVLADILEQFNAPLYMRMAQSATTPVTAATILSGANAATDERRRKK